MLTAEETSGTATITVIDSPGVANVTTYETGEANTIKLPYDSITSYVHGLGKILKSTYPGMFTVIGGWLVPVYWITCDTQGDVDVDYQPNAVLDIDSPQKEYHIKLPYDNNRIMDAIFKEH